MKFRLPHLVNPEFQHGVQSAQAMTQAWSMQHLILAYVIIWIIYFVKNFGSFQGTLVNWHYPTTILSTLVGGLFKLPYAFALMIVCMPVGLIMMAGCNNVQTYCAAQVSYSVGSTGVDFVMTIFIADTSALTNRAFWLAFTGSPYIATCKAQKAGLVLERHSQRTALESITHYGKEFDPSLIAFPLYERYVAPVTFIPWSLLLKRTVFVRYTMAASICLAWYLWDIYFYSMLVVVFNQSLTQATCFINIYSGALYFGVPITVLGVGLMVYFREPGVNIGYIIMCQIFIVFGGGTLVICEQMTVMAVSSQQHIPAVRAMESMLTNINSAVGRNIATALWAGVFPRKLEEYLPAERLMLIAAMGLYTVTLVSVMMWKDVNVSETRQVKGRGVERIPGLP
ncbi:uncharacterized protein BDW43DRAFT_298099 [Aspergillus alliaceus]|uniref:uncharacterized protein n=1 Tax=Petromyces alliaceus TaxID=209559 RepID=UPI0012A59528|nr:uncharacterized protein BDW43DRAFT_298099 [Aspergillus alliaceus]KAB8236476.1 hypothetical protein BDW43DRAFT_298099 [Aspergillus alliaceus]